MKAKKFFVSLIVLILTLMLPASVFAASAPAFATTISPLTLVTIASVRESVNPPGVIISFASEDGKIVSIQRSAFSLRASYLVEDMPGRTSWGKLRGTIVCATFLYGMRNGRITWSSYQPRDFLALINKDDGNIVEAIQLPISRKCSTIP